jgi:hypothetical protein
MTSIVRVAEGTDGWTQRLLTVAAVPKTPSISRLVVLYKGDRSYQIWSARFEKNKLPILRQ